MTKEQHRFRKWLLSRAQHELIITLYLLSGQEVEYGRLPYMNESDSIQAILANVGG